ncbi:MAG: DUF1489 domain-containing protein [Rhodospirillaceae bacterium]|jgi:hypothetical protein|nr:DUF1489 domain-containing protein [Rhodospirillales bacterium]MBT3906064.1 DUF1489 domain-containing protein [Rhodospirillaceae bacterium]MBT4699566.1 DUF1489 domain-containing protein [Rhodospirillaceae bacterium]MBT5036082.1 DUF1489 domain-containing protein [Rhodospirillaceae bacterium]MBT6220534.1 DUF1489 domain-containing protein [Rhodospirillaceae bacterium]
MTLNLIKLAVGVEDVDHLQEIQTRRLKAAALRSKETKLFHITRNKPRRMAELIEGGSMYWVIKGFVRARQCILGVEDGIEGETRSGCGLVLEPILVRTQMMPWKPFQGWRYLEGENAPVDVNSDASEVELPAEMAAELRNLGLL